MNQHQVNNNKKKLGFVNPVLYQMQLDGVFTDLTVGNNSCTEFMCCPTRADGSSDFGILATTGYDPVTGLDMINMTKALAWLDANTH